MVLNSGEDVTLGKAKSLTLLESVGFLLISRVDRSLQVTAGTACVLEASNPLITRGAIGEERSDLLRDNSAREGDVVQSRSLASGGIVTIGADGPQSLERLRRMVGLDRRSVNADTADGTCTSSNLCSLGKLGSRVQSKQLRRRRGLRDGNRQGRAALVANSDLLIDRSASKNIAKGDAVVCECVPVACAVGEFECYSGSIVDGGAQREDRGTTVRPDGNL